MSTLLKDLYNPSFYDQLGNVLLQTCPDFQKDPFIEAIFAGNWEEKELKDRMRHTATVLRDFLPESFDAAGQVILNSIEGLRKEGVKEPNFEYMFFPDYVERFGMAHFETSVDLFKKITPFSSCEFAVRPFLIHYGAPMIQQMLEWSLHPNHHVRRLASEGIRPRLPWAMALPDLKKDPKPILPLLDNLKQDPSEYVRRSVANNLNDISKDHPDVLLEVLVKWEGISDETTALLKHASRTLLKQGDPAVMQYFGFANSEQIDLQDFSIVDYSVKIGDALEFHFQIQNLAEENMLIRLEYGIFYLRKNGSHSKKVFKISERELAAGEVLNVKRKQSFKRISTRTFYPGQQAVSIILNGVEKSRQPFELVE